MAVMVNRTKRAIENWKLPPPDIKGGSGRPDKWKWSTIRPVLEAISGRELPGTLILR
jgi:hypothetical protein